MFKVIYPGTFNPPTLGHLNIIKKAASLFGHVYVAVGGNSRKNNAVFSVEERVSLLKKITHSLSNVEITAFDGLLTEFATSVGAKIIVRSIRNMTDFDYENLIAQTNRQIGNIETVFIIPDKEFLWISSTLVREIGSYGKRLEAFVPLEIEPTVFKRLFKHKE